MKLDERCRAVSARKIDDAVAKDRKFFMNLLMESCKHVKENPAGNVCPNLSNRLGEYLDYFLPAYAKANLSARHHQKSYNRGSASVFTLSALAIIIVSAQHLFHLPHILVVGELLCISMILIIFHWGNHRRWLRNWVDCRYFAERIRIGIHIAFLCGKSAIPDGPQLSERHKDISWCNAEFHDLMHDRPHPCPLSEDHKEIVRHFMITHWFKDQVDFHRRTARRKLRQHKVVSRIGETCFGLTLVAAILHLTSHSLRHTLHVDHILTDSLLTFVVIALPAIATSFAGVRGHFDFKKKGTRSEMIARQLENLITRAEEAKDLAELTLVVLRAEELTIQEATGWHLHTVDKVITAD